MAKTIPMTIELDEAKLKALEDVAKAEGKTISELVEESLDSLLNLPDKEVKSISSKNPLLEIAGIASTGLGDGALHHDEYLYTKKTSSK